MKTLGKLKINPKKIIKDEELKELRGGWLGDCAILDDGAYLETRLWICSDMTYAWECDQNCAAHFQQSFGSGYNISCFCNWPY